MVPNAKEILTNENKLLGDLITTATNYSNGADGLTRALFDGWVQGLTRHRAINDRLLNQSGAAFDTDVGDEIRVLEDMIAAIKKKNEVTNSWIEHLNDDIGFLKQLI